MQLSLIRQPDRTELRQKTLFSVSGECPVPVLRELHFAQRHAA